MLRLFKCNLKLDGDEEDSDEFGFYCDGAGKLTKANNDYIYVVGDNISVIDKAVAPEYIKNVEYLGETIVWED